MTLTLFQGFLKFVFNGHNPTIEILGLSFDCVV